MKVKEIEFGVTVNLGNYESSKLSLRVQLEEWEDYKQSLAKLKEEVVKLAGGDVRTLRQLATDEMTQDIIEEIAATQSEFNQKKEELEDLTYGLGKLESNIRIAKKIVEHFKKAQNQENIQQLNKIVSDYETLNYRIQNTESDSEF